MIDHALTRLLIETLRVCGVSANAAPDMLVELPMPGRGYSGAQLRRFEVHDPGAGGQTPAAALVVKDAGRLERRTLLHLYRQGHACIPFCHTLDLERDGREPLCMEYVAADPQPAAAGAAEAAAAIHARNLGAAGPPGWLPPAGGAFIRSGFVLGTFRPAWAAALQDPAFRKEFGSASADLETAAECFVQDVEGLWQAGDTLTLIHCDLHDGNVVYRAGQPYILDWEQAHWGPFYLDVPNLFPGEQARAYYQALQDCGIALDEQQFFERCGRMGRYVGFKYLGFVLSFWAQRDEPGSWVRGALENLVGLALHGGSTGG
jgi:hypothetical protein